MVRSPPVHSITYGVFVITRADSFRPQSVERAFRCCVFGWRSTQDCQPREVRLSGGIVAGVVGVPTAYSLHNCCADRKSIRLILIFFAGVRGVETARRIPRVPAKAQPS